MPRAKRPSVDQQLTLLDIAGWTPRRVERAFGDAVAAARADGALSKVDDGAVTLGRALARAVDMAEVARDPWALAAVAREYKEVIARLRLDPVSRAAGSGRGDLAALLSNLGTPDVDDDGAP